MNHALLLLLCCLSLEILNRTQFFQYLNSISNLLERSFYIISSSKISDHWKGLVLPKYSLLMIKHSCRILFALILIIFLSYVFNIFSADFFLFIFSWIGLLESFSFIALYYFLNRNRFTNE